MTDFSQPPTGAATSNRVDHSHAEAQALFRLHLRRWSPSSRGDSIFGALTIVALAAGTSVWAGTSSDDADTRVVIDLNELVAGQCLNEPNFEDMELIVFSVSIVDCAEPHDVEVTEVFDLTDEPGAAYPGDTAMYHAAVPRCEKTFEKYVGEDYYSSALEIGVYFPMEAGWQKYDDRRVVCYVSTPTSSS